jgi:hypothetical protein
MVLKIDVRIFKIDARIFDIDARIFKIDARIRNRFWRLVHLAAELRTPRRWPSAKSQSFLGRILELGSDVM